MEVRERMKYKNKRKNIEYRKNYNDEAGDPILGNPILILIGMILYLLIRKPLEAYWKLRDCYRKRQNR